MENNTNNKDVKAKKARKSDKAKVLTELMNGDFFTREFVVNNLEYIFFILVLLGLVIGKGYYGKGLSKDIDVAQKSLDEMTAEYVESKAKLEEVTKRQVLVEKLEPLGLKETVNPTKVIRLKKENEGK